MKRAKLRVRRNGRLTARHGSPLLPEVYIPRWVYEVRVSSKGAVIGIDEKRGTPGARIVFGNLNAATFEHPELLATADGIVFSETEESGPPMVGLFGSDFNGIVSQSYP